MKCKNCGFENKKGAAFCTKCGSVLKESETAPQVNKSESAPQVNKSKTVSQGNAGKSNKSKFLILGLVIVIIILATVIGYFALNGDLLSNISNNNSNDVILPDNNSDNQSVESSEDTTKTKEVKSKSWELIGTYSGSGSGRDTIEVPEGKIKVKLSAYPIKNYATNHLYVSGPDGASGGVDWGSSSAVETRSDSFKCNLDSEAEFIIDYYETVNWEVKFYRYQ